MKPEEDNQPQRTASLPRRLWGWLGSAVVEHPVLFCLAGVAGLLVLFYLEENWSGKRAWTRYEREMKAKGVSLNLSDLMPPPVPDDLNFAATPFWSALNYKGDPDYQEDTNRWPETFTKAFKAVSSRRLPRPAAYRRWKLDDLSALEFAFANPDRRASDLATNLPPVGDAAARARAGAAILEHLKVYDPVIEELREASGRPKARFPIDYELMILMPHLAKVKSVSQLLKTKVSSALAVGDSDQALKDLLLMFRLIDSLKDEPFLISQLVRFACFHLAANGIWQGMALESWSDAQLRAIQDRLDSMRFLDGLELALKGERVWANTHCDAALNDDSATTRDLMRGFGLEMPAFSYMPSGWLYFEKLNINLLYDAHIQPEPVSGPVRVQPGVCDQRAGDLDTALRRSRGPIDMLWSHTIFAGMLLPSVSKSHQKAAHVQAFVEIAMVSCAVERFKLARGWYPESLDALAPDFIGRIPTDVVAAEPYPYRREEGGRYVLYSVGWNETDNGGTEAQDVTVADWVWRY